MKRQKFPFPGKKKLFPGLKTQNESLKPMPSSPKFQRKKKRSLFFIAQRPTSRCEATTGATHRAGRRDAMRRKFVCEEKKQY
ncbi:MAG: hypothetical protein IKR18_06605 [Bacteroidaceae bacterium]|nr:hypothetical protein [Bacteroidaceae bacterium]